MWRNADGRVGVSLKAPLPRHTHHIAFSAITQRSGLAKNVEGWLKKQNKRSFTIHNFPSTQVSDWHNQWTPSVPRQTQATNAHIIQHTETKYRFLPHFVADQKLFSSPSHRNFTKDSVCSNSSSRRSRRSNRREQRTALEQTMKKRRREGDSTPEVGEARRSDWLGDWSRANGYWQAPRLSWRFIQSPQTNSFLSLPPRSDVSVVTWPRSSMWTCRGVCVCVLGECFKVDGRERERQREKTEKQKPMLLWQQGTLHLNDFNRLSEIRGQIFRDLSFYFISLFKLPTVCWAPQQDQ